MLTPLEKRRGNRISTLMVYLENVSAGGSTVFPLIGVKIKPFKGAAVFWWNLRRDGGGDPLTRHGGCPVLVGQKWITNKWIRYNGQFNVAKCVPEGDEFIKEL
jgi:prolyl 4-hydroxylase